MIRPNEPLKRTVARVCRTRDGDPLVDLGISCYVRWTQANYRLLVANNAYLQIPVGGSGETMARALTDRWSALNSALFQCHANTQGLYPRPDLACAAARAALRHPNLPSIDALFAQKRMP